MEDRSRILLRAIGNTIRKIREKRNMTQEYVAEQVGMTIEEFEKLESGNIKGITREELDNFINMINADRVEAEHI